MQKLDVAMGLIVAICLVVGIGFYLTRGTAKNVSAATLSTISPNVTTTILNRTTSNATKSVSTSTIPNNITAWDGSAAIATARVAQDVNSFGFGVYSKLNNESNNESANLLFSPFSISTALSMTAVGAGGITRREFDSLLGLSANATENNVGFDEVLNSILPQGAGYNLSVADGIWVEQTFPINQTFVSTLSTYYDAGATNADFANNPGGVRSEINGWVANRTNNRILNLLPNGALENSTKLVLVNAMHFKANWTQQFNLAQTHNSLFYVSATKKVNASMMHGVFDMPYYSDGQLEAVELDYQNSNITMLLILPNQVNGLAGVESGLSANRLTGIEAGLTEQSVAVAIPKFNITTPSISMKSMLESLGLMSAFNPTLANLSLINQTAQLYISDVYHKAFITVNEKGTEAAAATAVVVDQTVIAKPISTPKAFNAYHPFLFFIIDKKSGTILFMGREADPASTS